MRGVRNAIIVTFTSDFCSLKWWFHDNTYSKFYQYFKMYCNDSDGILTFSFNIYLKHLKESLHFNNLRRKSCQRYYIFLYQMTCVIWNGSYIRINANDGVPNQLFRKKYVNEFFDHFNAPFSLINLSRRTIIVSLRRPYYLFI